MSINNEIFKEFIEKNYPSEQSIAIHFNYDIQEISEINSSPSSKVDDSLGFGEDFSLLSNVAAFIFLVASQKLVELGIELSRDKLLKVILDNKDKLIKLAEERYDADIEEVLSKIINFLQSRKK